MDPFYSKYRMANGKVISGAAAANARLKLLGGPTKVARDAFEDGYAEGRAAGIRYMQKLKAKVPTDV
jgi:hypothetical protein